MRSSLVTLTLVTAALLPGTAWAEDYYAAPNGNGDGLSASTPTSTSNAVNRAQPGDTVYFLSGTYTGWSGAPRPVRSGTADAWITFAAYAGALPIFEGSGVGSGQYEYIRYVGLVARNGASGGFGNGWTDGSCTQLSNSNLQYINCIADNNGINGIAHYCASGVLIKQSIVAHNGNQLPSWSSGVNLFSVKGPAGSNVVEQTISFENLDISDHHSDGSGFILDQNSTGATFVNNIGFRNGGSCIRITNSPNAQLINNTCVHNGVDPTLLYHDEIFFSDGTSRTGAVLRNNLTAPTSGQRGLAMGDGVPSENNLWDGEGLLVSATGALDFHLLPGAAAIDAGSSTNAPAADAGFDWRCIKQQSGQAVSWWSYAIDYEYIAAIGGVAACFAPGARTGAPDVGAYEYGAATGTGGAAATGGTSGTGGVTATGGAVSTGGTTATGGAVGTGGTTAGCASPFVDCGGRCVELASDPAHCGVCGTTCSASEVCSLGTCAPSATCQAPLELCAGVCVDTSSDAASCGACQAACATGTVCSAGACSAAGCAAGLTQCGQACVDTATNILSCGACGVVCASGQTCTAGVCTGTSTGGDPTQPVGGCATGLVACGQSCVDVTSSVLHCGACNAACLGGQTCAAGVCLGDATGPDPTVAAAPADDEAGCGCAVPQPHRLPLGALAAAACVALALTRRRRR